MSKILENNDKYVMDTYSKFNLSLTSGKGALCYDENGKEYIDLTSGIGVNSLGFCNREWVDAICAQANKIQHTSNLYYNEPSSSLARVLCEKTSYKKVFFSNSGAEANECAIKLARKYSFDKYGKGRDKIITLKNSFHGRTVLTLSATGQDVFHNYFFPFNEGFIFSETNNIENLLNNIKDDVCGIMIELIQGEGGVKVLDKDFVLAIEKLAKEKDLILICDEVQTGMGRTGKLLTSEHFKIHPDITTLAKGLGGGLPIGATLCNEKCQNVMNKGSHGSTFGGNPIVTAGALAVLNKVGDEEFLNSIQSLGEYFKTELKKFKKVKSVSGLGLMIGVEVEDKTAKEYVLEAIDLGVLCLTAKEKIRLLPPLNISILDVEKALSILKTILD